MPHSPRRPPPPPPPQPPPPPKGRPDRRALLQAYNEVVRTTKEKPAPVRQAPPTRRTFWITMGLTIAGLVALLVFQPAWMFSKPPAEPPQLQEASLRIRMFVEIERVEHYKTANGRLPVSLIEAGGDSTGLRFAHRGEGYTLTGWNGPLQLTYTSGSSAEGFLGNSYQLVRERGK